MAPVSSAARVFERDSTSVNNKLPQRVSCRLGAQTKGEWYVSKPENNKLQRLAEHGSDPDGANNAFFRIEQFRKVEYRPVLADAEANG